MDSTIENTDKEADFATEQLEESPEASSEEETEKTSEETGENAVENGTVAGRNLGEQSSSEINVDFETEKAGQNDGNTEQQAVEVVEIEEKVIIETLDEAKSVQGNAESVQESQDSIVVENRNETIDLLSNVETETQFRTSEIHSEPVEPPGEVKQRQEWTDLLGNGLLKKKVSFYIILSGMHDAIMCILCMILTCTGLCGMKLLCIGCCTKYLLIYYCIAGCAWRHVRSTLLTFHTGQYRQNSIPECFLEKMDVRVCLHGESYPNLYNIEDHIQIFTILLFGFTRKV